MIITHHGGEHFKITHGSLTIAINPVSKQSKLKQTRYGADIALITTKHPDFDGVDMVTHGEKEPFVISGAGEYEVGGIFVKGFQTKTMVGGEERINTIYTFKVDDIAICFLGALGDQELTVEAKEAFDEVDILFVPIGGDGVLSAADAYKFAVKREPSIIIPMHYDGVGEKDSLKTFLKEGGADGTKPVDKVVLKKKDLTGTGSIVVLES